jgi:transcriptional regulatory protein RtcR
MDKCPAQPGRPDRGYRAEPGLLLAQFSEENGAKVHFNRDARERYMHFAMSPEALCADNFRDLSASVARMVTLAEAGGVTDAIVEALRAANCTPYRATRRANRTTRTD